MDITQNITTAIVFATQYRNVRANAETGIVSINAALERFGTRVLSEDDGIKLIEAKEILYKLSEMHTESALEEYLESLK